MFARDVLRRADLTSHRSQGARLARSSRRRGLSAGGASSASANRRKAAGSSRKSRRSNKTDCASRVAASSMNSVRSFPNTSAARSISARLASVVRRLMTLVRVAVADMIASVHASSLDGNYNVLYTRCQHGLVSAGGTWRLSNHSSSRPGLWRGSAGEADGTIYPNKV